MMNRPAQFHLLCTRPFHRCLAAMILIVAANIGSRASVRAEDIAPQVKLPPVRAVAFSPDGRLLAAVSGEPKDQGALAVWEIATKQQRLFHQEAVGVPSVAFAPDGKSVAIGLFEPVAKLLDVDSGTVVRTFAGHTNHVRSVAFSKAGDRLLTASYDRTVKLWDVASGTTLMTFEGHTDSVMSAAICPENGIIVSCGNDQTTRLWDPATGTQQRLLKPTEFVVRRVAFSPDGRVFATCHFDGTVRIRDMETARLRARIATGGGAEWAHFSPDGTALAVCTSSRDVQLFDVDLKNPSLNGERSIAALITRWDDDDYQTRERASAELVKIGMSAESQLRKAMESESAEVRIRARRAHTAVWSPPPRTRLTGHDSEVYCAVFSPDGKLLAAGEKSGIVKVWDISTLTCVATLHPEAVAVKEP